MEEEIKLFFWFEIWGDVNAQGTMGFSDQLLLELLYWTGWGGSDPKSS